MTQVKITSDPYRRETSFLCREGEDSEWGPVNQRSKLLKSDILHAFFPFKAKEILDTIASEYWVDGGQPVMVIFEGASDEFKELEALTKEGDCARAIDLVYSGRRLSNARDILPEIVAIFRDLRPFFEEYVPDRSLIEDDLRKFSEATNESIPICVMGNYSSGKSTFINALVGGELLPSGDAPITALIYQIRRSRHEDRGRIAFYYDGERVSLLFDETGFMGLEGAQDAPVVAALKDVFAQSTSSMFPQMHAALEVINDFVTDDGRRRVSDLVEIEVPFSRQDAWGMSSDFVIFDTPGSNNATQASHLRVLRDAMQGMSNGLPVYVSEFDSLSTTDNLSLYDSLREIDSFDMRFAMIVVNKADAASLPKKGFTEDDEADILRQGIPAHMYSQGIYFVSSIIGLGAKVGGEFESDSYAEKFEDHQRKYSDPSSRFYKRLYDYDIMPEQIRARSVEGSRACSNLMLANSGLYAVELAVETFANKYSSYNKCLQAQRFLDQLIGVTTDTIDTARQENEQSRKELEEELKSAKRELIKALDKEAEGFSSKAHASYEEALKPIAEDACGSTSVDMLQDERECYLNEERTKGAYQEASDQAKDARHAIGENLQARFSQLVEKKNLESAGEMFGGFVSDVKGGWSAAGELRELDRQYGVAADQRLLAMVEERLKELADSGRWAVDTASREYWMGASQRCRDAIVRVVAGTEGIDEGMRQELTKIIAEFRPLEATLPEDLFDWARLHEQWLFIFRLPDSDSLNIRRLSETFDGALNDFILGEVYPAVEKSHGESFDAWRDELMGLLHADIVDYSLDLKAKREAIERKQRRIEELQGGLERLERNKEQVAKMVAWTDGEEDHGN